MIIFSRVQSEDIANFVWVVPIQSSVKPEVTASDMELFRILTDYFEKARPEKRPPDGSDESLDRKYLEVLESKEVDIFDITILKANDAEELVQWLNQNGYRVPPEARAMFAKYIDRGSDYFIANRIDLKNLYGAVFDLLDARKRQGGEYIDIDRSEFSLIPHYLHWDKNDPLYQLGGHEPHITECIVGGLTFERAREKHKNILYFITRKEYEALRKEYALPFGPNPAGKTDWAPWVVGRVIHKDRPYEGFWEATSVMGDITEEEIIERYELVLPKVERIVQAEKGPFLVIEDKWKGLLKTLDDLGHGLGTPLKIVFRPRRFYYPLEISGMGEGYTQVNLYAIHEKEVYDRNGILKTEAAVPIDEDLRKKLENILDLGNAKYVTRLYYQGDMKGFTTDTVLGDSP